MFLTYAASNSSFLKNNEKASITGHNSTNRVFDVNNITKK